MKIQMVDLQGQYQSLKREIDSAIADVVTSGQFIRGPVVENFQGELAGYLGGPYALGVANGTDALQIAYMALGIKAGDEVITPAFTFVATAEAAALLGATPVFADIDPETFGLDPARLAALITPKTKAIVPVHLFGHPCDLDPILEIGRRHCIPIIEDNAQAIGATYKGERTGYLGDIGTLSFFPSKNLGAYGDGGAVLTCNRDLHDRFFMISNHGGRRKYFHESIGLNSRLDAVQAAVLRVKLTALDRFAEARKAAARRYDAHFADCSSIATPTVASWAGHVYHQYTLRIKNGRRDMVAAHLKDHGIPYGIYYPVPLHQLPAFKNAHKSGPLPHSERATREVISLPMHTELTADQQEYVASAVLEAVQGT